MFHTRGTANSEWQGLPNALQQLAVAFFLNNIAFIFTRTWHATGYATGRGVLGMSVNYLMLMRRIMVPGVGVPKKELTPRL